MKVSQLIKKLAALQKKHGDLPVFVEEFGDKSVREVFPIMHNGEEPAPGEKPEQIFIR